MTHSIKELTEFLESEIKVANKRMTFFNSFDKTQCKDYKEIIEKLTAIKKIIAPNEV